MRPLATLGVGLCGLLLWGVILWRGVLVPWEVTVRPVAPVPPVAAPRWLRAEVVRSVPGLEGLALGDAVVFDRYGIVPPVAGTVHCVPLLPTGGTLHVTPIGGELRDVGVVRLSVGPPAAAGCAPASLEPLVPRHP